MANIPNLEEIIKTSPKQRDFSSEVSKSFSDSLKAQIYIEEVLEKMNYELKFGDKEEAYNLFFRTVLDYELKGLNKTIKSVFPKTRDNDREFIEHNLEHLKNLFTNRQYLSCYNTFQQFSNYLKEFTGKYAPDEESAQLLTSSTTNFKDILYRAARRDPDFQESN